MSILEFLLHWRWIKLEVGWLIRIIGDSLGGLCVLFGIRRLLDPDTIWFTLFYRLVNFTRFWTTLLSSVLECSFIVQKSNSTYIP